MIRSLLFFLIISLTFVGFSQNEQLEEKTPRFLILPKVDLSTLWDSVDVVAPFPIDLDSIHFIIPDPYPWDPFPYPYPNPFPFEISAFIFTPESLCGERFYNNGNLRSRCACNADSVLQGKSVYWEENGRISSVVYYGEGKAYTKKVYEEGRVTELRNYAYRNGEQLLHGEHIEYADNQKTIGKYAFGKKVGSHITYSNGIKSIVETFKNDNRIREERFGSEGKLYALTNYDDSGNPIGESFNFSQDRKIKVVTTYENGRKKSVKRFNSGVLVEHEEYNPELVLRMNFFDNGDSLRLSRINSDGSQILKEWDESGMLITDYEIENSKFVRKGFHTQDKRTTRFEQKFNSDGSDHLECWVIVSGDTTEFYYARNEGDGFNTVIAKNYFVQSNGRAVKHRKWITYKNNQLISEINYSQGKKHGKAVYYDTTRAEPIPYIVGNYHLGVKNNTWTLRNDTILIESNYHAGNLSGGHSVYSRKADTTFLEYTSELPQNNRRIEEALTPIVQCSFKKGLLNDKFRTFWENGEMHIKGYYENGEFVYHFRANNPDGSLYRVGYFTDGEPSGKWYLISKKKNGKTKRKREKRPLIAPKIEIPLIKDLIPGFSVLTGNMEANV